MKQIADDMAAFVDNFTISNHPFLSSSVPIALPSAFGHWSLLNSHTELRQRAQNVCSFADHLRFKRSLAWKVDYEVWETLVADLDLFDKFHIHEIIEKAVEDRGEQNLIERSKFFTHMLKAFRDGDRFIVAKLAYDGGAA